MSWVCEPGVETCGAQCGARCCKTPGYIPLTVGETALFPPGIARTSVTNRGGTFAFEDTDRLYYHFSDNGGQCPHLTGNNLCAIHTTRPEACRTFPDHPAEYCLVWPILDATPP